MTEIFGRWAQAPDLIEPILAYRCWRYVVMDGATRLFSLGFHGASGRNDWDGSWRGWVTASCPLSDTRHDAPAEACSCGFYALKSADEAAWHLFGRDAGEAVLKPQGSVLGRVRLAGKVIEHDSGYRAERARI